MQKNIIKYRDDLRELLKYIFDPGVKWGINQIKSYELLKHYLNTFGLRYIEANGARDKYIILDNLQGQPWYQVHGESVHNVITKLIDQIVIVKLDAFNTDLTKVLNLVIDFRGFQLHCYYYQQIGELVALQIYLAPKGANPVTKRNYLAYNIKGNITIIPPEIADKMELPELTDIHELTGINDTMIDSNTLLNFFLETILYYDETETILNVKLSHDSDKDISGLLGAGGTGGT